MTAPAGAAWGRAVVEETVAGHPCRVYRDRRRAASDLLVDAGRWRDRAYLVQGERRLTYAAHEQAVHRVARWLSDEGVGRGDRVVLLGANHVEWVVSFWAVLQAGGVAVAANAWWNEREVGHAVDAVSPALVLADDRLAPRVPAGAPARSFGELRAVVDDVDRDVRVTPPPVEEDEPAVVLFTSGTTGAAKGATLSHRALVANQHNLLYLTRRLPSELPDDHPGTVSLLTVPLFHMGGVQTMCSTLLTGGRLVMLTGRFDSAEVLAVVEQERVQTWGAVPTMVSRVLDDPGFVGRDVSSVTSITLGGASVSPELAARARAAFPNARRGVGTLYGLTESGGALTAASGREVAERPGCVGRPLPVVELRIGPAAADGVGEILARTPAAMTGYWGIRDDPILDGDGWLHTGDLGWLDDDGYLYVVDRSKDVVIRGGENIATPHVEAVLLEHPAVADAAVVGLPHADLGEELAAAVVLRPGATVSEEELRAHAATSLAHFEVPSRWWVRREPLPTNAVGKVVKRELRGTWPP